MNCRWAGSGCASLYDLITTIFAKAMTTVMAQTQPEGTPLFERFMAAHGEAHDGINRRVWYPVPFMLDVQTEGREQEMLEWCFNTFGPESWLGGEGRWHRGSATIDGWTWFGFSTREEMEQFAAKFPSPARQH